MRVRTALLLIPLLLCCSCSRPGEIVGAVEADLPLPPGFALGFNHRESGRYQSPLTGQWRNGDDLEKWIVDAIQGADNSLLVAVQELSLPTLARHLIAAHQRGVQVNVVLENNYSTPWSDLQPSHLAKHQRHRWHQLHQLADADGDGITTAQEARDGDAVRLLLEAGIPLIDDTEDGSSGSGLMHHKFVVIDECSVITGSANFTNSGLHGDAGKPSTRGNVNHLLRIDSPALAEVFRREFERMWGDGPGGAKDSHFGLGKGGHDAERISVGDVEVEVLFSPHPKRNASHGLHWLAALLSSAQQQIDMALFVFSAQQLANVLEERANDGIKIRLVADPGFASRSFSEVLDLLGVALPDRDCKLEVNNQPFKKPIRGVGTPRLARGDKLHHKFAVIDNKTVITGSFNWSPSAAHTNDETLLVIHSPQLAKHFTREMDRLWDTAELGITPHLQRKLDRQRIRCGNGVERD